MDSAQVENVGRVPAIEEAQRPLHRVRTRGFQVVAQNPLQRRLVIVAACGAADIANKVDHDGLDDGHRNPGRLIREYLLRSPFVCP